MGGWDAGGSKGCVWLVELPISEVERSLPAQQRVKQPTSKLEHTTSCGINNDSEALVTVFGHAMSKEFLQLALYRCAKRADSPTSSGQAHPSGGHLFLQSMTHIAP